MNQSIRTVIVSVCFVLSIAGTAVGTPYTYDMGSESKIDTTGTNAALEMHALVNPALDQMIFSLDVGESKQFHFAKIWTNETWINQDDIDPGHVMAYVDFDLPLLTADVSGTSVGFSGCLSFTQGWTLTWHDPVFVDFGNGGRFSLEIQDAYYASGFWQGPDGADCIKAKVTHLATPVQVPEPPGLLLVGLGCLGLAGLARNLRLQEA